MAPRPIAPRQPSPNEAGGHPPETTEAAPDQETRPVFGEREGSLMDSTTSTDTTKEISLLDSLNQSWLKLPLAVMRDVGPATQTLGAIVRLTTTEMYCSVSKISDISRLPVATTRKHLVTLNDMGWLDNVGREHTRAGRARRTCTIKLTAKTKSTLNDYSILPWWANGLRVGFFPWSAKAVLSVVISKLTAMKAAIERQYGTGHDTEHFWDCLENMGGEDQFRFSLDRLHRDT